MSTTTHPGTSTGASAGTSARSSGINSSGSRAKADEMKKRWKMEEEMREFERECRQEARRKREALLDQAISDGIDVSSLTFLSAPLSSPDVSLSGSTVGDEITKLLGSQRIRGNVRDSKKFAHGTEAYARFRSKFASEVIDVPGASKEEKFTALCDRVKDEAKEIVDAFIYEEDKGEALDKALKELDFYY